VAEQSVSRLLQKRYTPPSQTRRTFPANHVQDLVSLDFFTIPTASLRALFVLVRHMADDGSRGMAVRPMPSAINSSAVG
jgi:hypothetical protein